MKAVQIEENKWFVPKRGGYFFYNNMNNLFMYAESGLENDFGLPVGKKDFDLPAFLRRCGYTLVWLDGRVEDPVVEDSLTTEQAVAAERERILSDLEEYFQIGKKYENLNGYLWDGVKAIVEGGEV